MDMLTLKAALKSLKIKLMYKSMTLDEEIDEKYKCKDNLKVVDEEQVIKDLDRMTPIKFQGVDKVHSPSVDIFINKEFWDLNKDHYTVNNMDSAVCGLSRFRSLVDIYRICKYYYKDNTPSPYKVREMLRDDANVRTWICVDVQRRVFGDCALFRKKGYSSVANEPYVQHHVTKDEFGLTL